MDERRPHQNMSEAEIEGFVSSLPRARPPADLRGRVLASRPRRAGRSPLALRPALAATALAALLLAEWAVAGWSPDRLSRPRPRVSEAMMAEMRAEQRELGIEGRPLLLLPPSPPPANPDRTAGPDSYWSLRRQLEAGA